MKIYGLTGGVASGKSAVAAIFRELGAAVLDADAIARELRAPGSEGHAYLLSTFGTADARELRGIVFRFAGRETETARGVFSSAHSGRIRRPRRAFPHLSARPPVRDLRSDPIDRSRARARF